MNSSKKQPDHYTLSVILGALATLGFAPFNLTGLLVASFALLYFFLSSDITKTRAFLIGIWFGLAHFSTGFYWFAFALATDIYKFGWLIPFAVFGLSLFFSLYFAIAFLAFRAFKYKSPFSFSVIITASEILRGTLFTGFPWNSIGYTWNSLEILQFSSVFGIYGMTFITVFISGSAGALLLDNGRKKHCLCSILLLVLIYSWGNFRLETNKIEYSDTKVRIVQANISHQAEWSQEYAYNVLNNYLDLTNGVEDAHYVIWPESSIPFGLSHDSTNLPGEISKIVSGALIAGGNRIEGEEVFNTIFLMKDGKISDFYDKVKLVPFGEFMPFRKFIPIKKIVNGLSDFSNGEEDWKFFEDSDIIPTICYEDIFTFYPLRSPLVRAKFIVNLTNDSWFGISTGPYQHFQMARMRAIEYGLPFVRSTTTGISAIFDGYGRAIHEIGLNEEGVIDAYLPKPSKRRTFYEDFIACVVMIVIHPAYLLYSYGNFEDYAFLACLLLSTICCFALFKRLRRKSLYKNIRDFLLFFTMLFSMFYLYSTSIGKLWVLFAILYFVFIVKVIKNDKT